MAATLLAPPSLLHLAVLSMGAGPEGSTRRRVYAFVAQYPGLHQREIARRLEMRPSHVEHHLRHLVKAGVLRALESDRYVCYFPAVSAPGPAAATALGAEDSRRLALLRQPRPLRIVGILLQEDGLVLGDLAARSGISAGTLTYQLDKLEAAGIVERVREGRSTRARLRGRDHLVRLLLDHEPPADLVEGFASLWDDVGL